MCVDVGGLAGVRRGNFMGVVVKGGTATRVPISKAMSAALVDWRLHRGIPDPVERVPISPAGVPYTRTSLGQLIARIGSRAGIKRVPMRPHILRHTLNIIRRRAKIDPVTRSRLLTHTNLNSLHHYEHALDGELAAAREQQREGLREFLVSKRLCSQLSAPPVEPLPKSLK
jgi:integrase